MKHKIQNITMGETWSSYIASVYGILCSSKLWQGEVWQLMGMTGMAFHFIVHKNTCSSSINLYDWNLQHFQMMDRIGIYTDSICIYKEPGMNTYEKVKVDAIHKIKEAIDIGRGVVIWSPSGTPQFGIISGYDDNDQIFYINNYTEIAGKDADPLLYDNLGSGDIPYLYIQRFLNSVHLDPEIIYRESILYGIKHWSEHHISSKYSNGKFAYDTLISALQKYNYNEFGIIYLINAYADFKKCLARYLFNISSQSNHLKCIEEAVGIYNQISMYFQNMIQIAPFKASGISSIKKQQLLELIDLLKLCKKLETKAIKVILNNIEFMTLHCHAKY